MRYTGKNETTASGRISMPKPAQTGNCSSSQILQANPNSVNNTGSTLDRIKVQNSYQKRTIAIGMMPMPSKKKPKRTEKVNEKGNKIQHPANRDQKSSHQFLSDVRKKALFTQPQSFTGVTLQKPSLFPVSNLGNSFSKLCNSGSDVSRSRSQEVHNILDENRPANTSETNYSRNERGLKRKIKETIDQNSKTISKKKSQGYEKSKSIQPTKGKSMEVLFEDSTNPVSGTIPTMPFFPYSMYIPIEERLIHLLALTPSTYLEIFQRLSKEGLRERGSVSNVLERKAEAKENVYYLKEQTWYEVHDDWSHYTEFEKQIVNRKKREHITSLEQNSGSDKDTSPSSSVTTPLIPPMSNSECQPESNNEQLVDAIKSSGSRVLMDDLYISDDDDCPEYLTYYTTVTTQAQRKKYMADFERYYKEYEALHRDVEAVHTKFSELSEMRKKESANSPTCKAIEETILKEYEKKKKIIEQAPKVQDMRNKLAYIKKLIEAYDQSLLKRF